ncbi:MAG: hypothetical protein IPI44_24740 [Sulfuritalea sp.]|nr:hypothetical protein [Sulfuritalea sp.]
MRIGIVWQIILPLIEWKSIPRFFCLKFGAPLDSAPGAGARRVNPRAALALVIAQSYFFFATQSSPSSIIPAITELGMPVAVAAAEGPGAAADSLNRAFSAASLT